MQINFEHFAATSMLGAIDSPPRRNGSLHFDRDWEGRAFGLALALSKEGHYEWEAFRQELISAIAKWERAHSCDDPSWDYYQQWLSAFERLLLECDLVTAEEVQAKTIEQIVGLAPCSVNGDHSCPKSR